MSPGKQLGDAMWDAVHHSIDRGYTDLRWEYTLFRVRYTEVCFSQASLHSYLRAAEYVQKNVTVLEEFVSVYNETR